MIFRLMDPSSLGKFPAFEHSPLVAEIPGINCIGLPGCCGKIWGSSLARVRTPVPRDHFLYANRFPMNAKAHKEFVAAVRSSLEIPDDVVLKPGTSFGYQRLKLMRREIADFEWVYLWTMIISERLRRIFVAEGFTGWYAEPVEFEGKRGPESPDPYWELVIDGRGGRALTQPETTLLSRCPVCGRDEYNRGLLRTNPLDLEQWDGSDFFYFDSPEDGHFFITERVKEVFEREGLTEAYHPQG